MGKNAKKVFAGFEPSGVNDVMTKTLPLLALSLVLVGCDTLGPRSIRVETFDQNRRVNIENSSGRTLHNVRMSIWVEQYPFSYDCGKKRISEWYEGGAFDVPARFNQGIDVVSISGRCKEGTFYKRFDCRPPAVEALSVR